MANAKARLLLPSPVESSQRASLSSPAADSVRTGSQSEAGLSAVLPVASFNGTTTPANGRRLLTGGVPPGLVAGGFSKTPIHTAGGPLQSQPASGSPPLVNAVAVSPQRGPSRQAVGSPRKPQSIGKLLPEFQFTVEPSLLRRLLVSLIVAFVSPSLLKEDPFPPLALIISRQAVFRKLHERLSSASSVGHAHACRSRVECLYT
ncbi:hypothetical protein Efla_003943 [Eimeria flavescens]